MANTAHKTDEEKKEYFDSPEELDRKVDQLVSDIRSAAHFVVFTGAGLSTAAGIPDFRSGVNTVLETGPGCWEKKANIQKAAREGKPVKPVKTKKEFRVSVSKALPTKGHMALVALLEAGLLKHLISQNCDGLHRKSGIPADKITEVHGNKNLEICMKCSKGYMRDFRTRNSPKVHEHKTGRKCDDSKCGGDLMDTIINFNENLRECDVSKGFEQGGMADVMVGIGSSLTVTPAADMFGAAMLNRGKMWVVNLQKTPYTKTATQIYAKIDDVFDLLMKKLDLPIPEFRLKRYARLEMKKKGLSVSGVDEGGGPYSIFNNVTVTQHNTTLPPGDIEGMEEEGDDVEEQEEERQDALYMVALTFQGHHNEPNLSIDVASSLFMETPIQDIVMTYNPYQTTWESVTLKNDPVIPLPFKEVAPPTKKESTATAAATTKKTTAAALGGATKKSTGGSGVTKKGAAAPTKKSLAAGAGGVAKGVPAAKAKKPTTVKKPTNAAAASLSLAEMEKAHGVVADMAKLDLL